MKAWPLLMERRCMAGNWCEPVVSVICSVQMFLLQLITCKDEGRQGCVGGRKLCDIMDGVKQ